MSDVAEESRRLAQGAGLVALPGRALLEGSGADLLDYLQRMLTQDVAAVTPGHGAAACFLTPTGRVLAHLLLWRPADGRVLLDLAPGAAAAGVPALERYVIADDVVFTDRSALLARALLLGPHLRDALAGLGLEAPEPGVIVAAELHDVALLLLGRRFGALPSAEVLLPADGAEPARAALAAAAPACSSAALDVLRVEQLVPAYGAELDERVLPNEAGANDAVSFTKGCYPGQEPVIMAHHRGHPPHRLVRLTLDGDALPARDAALLVGGKPAGRLTTVVRGRDGHPAALGYVRHAHAHPGVVLTLADGTSARIA